MPPTLMVQFCSAARIVYAGFGCGCVVLGVVTADNPLVVAVGPGYGDFGCCCCCSCFSCSYVPVSFCTRAHAKENRCGAIRGRKD